MNVGFPDVLRALKRTKDVYALYQRVRRYLPRTRFQQFYRAWVVNNFFEGPARRKAFAARTGCALPGSLLISPTHRCNLSCLGCYAACYDQSQEMPAAQLDALVEEAARLGIFSITILGGEPFLLPNITELFLRHPDTAFRISTNGTLMDDAIITGLSNAGNAVVTISLEGFETETDSWRGAGVYEKVRLAMTRLREEKLLFGFSVILHQRNKHIVTSRQFLQTMQDAGNVFGLFFPYGPVGRQPREDVVIPAVELEAIYAEIAAHRHACHMLLIPEGYYSPDEPQQAFWNRGCQAGVSVHITPEGNVEPCNGIQFFTGNVFHQSLEEILTSGFYRDAAICAHKNGRKCIAVQHPRQLLSLIETHHARASNPAALPSLYRQAKSGAYSMPDSIAVLKENSACAS